MRHDNCPNCGSSLKWTGSKCLECGYEISDMQDPDLKVSGGVEIEPDQVLPACPKCSSQFDGWDCKKCGYALPEKHRKMHPKVVSADEAAKYLKESDRELDFD